jgi:hypothetical protein
LKGEGFKEKFNLPTDTVYYIDFLTDSLNIPHSELENAFQVYIPEDVFNILTKNEISVTARLAEKMLATEIVSSVLARALMNYDGGEQDLLPEGVVRSLTKRIETSTGLPMV